MKRTLELHRDQRGLVGKVMIVWLLLVAVLAVGAVDAGSIAFTTFKLSSVATEAAIDGAAELRQGGVGADEACEVARATVEAMQADLKMGKKFCEVDLTTGRALGDVAVDGRYRAHRKAVVHEALRDRRRIPDPRPSRRIASPREPV